MLCARLELTLAVRSKWTQIFAVVFALLALAVAWSGYILSGGSGVQDFARTSVSLVQLIILLVPLASLVIGVMTLGPDRGAAEMIFSQPVSRRTILLGKLFGLFLALAAAQGLGFGAAGVAISWGAGDEGAGRFLLLALGSLSLTAVSLAVAALVAADAHGRRRARALAVALATWFIAVVLFDVAALAAASFLRSGTASRLLIVSRSSSTPWTRFGPGCCWASRASRPSVPRRWPSSASPRDPSARVCSWGDRSRSGSCCRSWPLCAGCGASTLSVRTDPRPEPAEWSRPNSKRGAAAPDGGARRRPVVPKDDEAARILRTYLSIPLVRSCR